ncbi:MAG: hypothetical protein R3C05_10415 [Pirellulaceae bacterium]
MMKRTIAPPTTLLLLSILVSNHCQGKDRWPAFLGAGGNAQQAVDLPLTWSPTDHIAWQAVLPGHGQSSPIVWEQRLFATSVEGPDKDKYHTLCIDTRSGKELWRKTFENSVPVKNSYYVSRAAPTPVVDDQRVIALFESGDCRALRSRWRRTLEPNARH